MLMMIRKWLFDGFNKMVCFNGNNIRRLMFLLAFQLLKKKEKYIVFKFAKPK